MTKLNSTGTALLYSTYLGGTSFDRGLGIAVDASGNAYVSGYTQSADFPTTPGAYQTANRGNLDAFVVKITKTAEGPATTLTFTAASATTSDFHDAAQVQAQLTTTGGVPVPNETVTLLQKYGYLPR